MLESARVIKAKGIAFVTYTMRCSAEFAKEAMAEQVGSLTGWAALRARGLPPPPPLKGAAAT